MERLCSTLNCQDRPSPWLWRFWFAILTTLTVAMSLLPSTSYARNASAPVLLADGLLAGSETGDGVQPKSEPDKVTEDKLDRLGPIMSDIGGVAAEIVGGDPDGL